MAGIQAAAHNPHPAILDAVSIERVTRKLRDAGGQGGAAGIDKAAAIAIDPGGISDDHLGALAADFDIPTQLAGIGAVDFVQNHLGAATGQVGITLNPAAQLGLDVAAAIIENRAVVVDIELLILIA